MTISETWQEENPNNWQAYDLVHERDTGRVAVQDGALEWRYAAQGVKLPPEHYVVRATAVSSDGRFVGDYIGAEAYLVRLRFWCSHAPRASVVLYDGSNYWRHPLSHMKLGQWNEIEIPVHPGMLQTYSNVDASMAFHAGLQNVRWVGVSVERNSSMEEQVYRVDDFSLVCGSDAFDVWMRQYAGDTRTRSSQADLDGDGISNYGEWVAGTSADDASDAFRVRAGGNGYSVAEGTGAGHALRWSSAAGRVYSVWRSTNLTAEDGWVLVDNVSATPPENVYRDTQSGGNGPYFYRVTVHREGAL